MAIIKCKMCGGDLSITEGTTVAECEYCGSVQTVPTMDHEKKITLFGRANRLRLACEFDKAAGVYESIVADFSEEAEAYWGLVLCRYGIEYVDDPQSGKKIPTCHRSSFDSIMEDSDFEQVLENADVVARKVYRDEAKAIEELRKGILEVSGKEEPYDIFICYKETDEKGDRTIDSVIAQDVYDALTEKGYRVFFSRISLEEKLGTEYEPYIFAALNSAKVMLVFGTDYENFNAVWVKNEWSRYLSLITAGQKKALIPCFKGIDAYDMPKEFQRLQAQDMGKIGAIQDLLRGIEKILNVEKAVSSSALVAQQSGVPSVASLLERGMLCLEDANWDKAGELFDQVLNIEPKCAEAYLGLIMVGVKCRSRDNLMALCIDCAGEGEAGFSNSAFDRAKQFAKGELQEWFESLKNAIEAKKREVEEEQRRAEERRREKERQKEEEKRREEERQRGEEKRREEERRRAEERQRVEENQRRGRFFPLRQRIAPAAHLINCGSRHAVGVLTNGTAVATGENEYGQCDVFGWTDIITIFAGYDYTVGLKVDGTVMATGNNEDGQCNVSDWTNITAISAYVCHTVGLRVDGTVVATGDNQYGQCNVSSWADIVAISAGGDHTVGLRADGTVVATGSNRIGQRNVSEWADIVAISAGDDHTAGLRKDGTVVTTGDNQHGQCNVSSWTDIIAIATGYYHTIGLKANGTAVATGNNSHGQCDVSEWSDIVAVTAEGEYTVGLKSDGTVVACGRDIPQDILDWRLFNSLDSLDLERVEARRQLKEDFELLVAEGD